MPPEKIHDYSQVQSRWKNSLDNSTSMLHLGKLSGKDREYECFAYADDLAIIDYDDNSLKALRLAIRIIGNITSNKLRILRHVDNIYISLLKNQGLYHHIWQAGAVLLNVKTTGVMGDASTYENVIALRAVQSSDGMTANIYHFDCHFDCYLILPVEYLQYPAFVALQPV